MEQIKEDYVSFETAKLLKEKEFDEPSSGLYNIEGLQIDAENYVLPFKNSDDTVNALIAAPTQSLVLKWLRIKYNILIIPEYNFGTKKWEYGIILLYSSEKTSELIDKLAIIQPEFDSPEEATEAAIQYTLNHLI